MKIRIIADDFTGANDIALQIRKYGLKTMTLIDQESFNDSYDVVIESSESRNIDPQLAREKLEKIYDKYFQLGFDKIYKKIDSTLRGNIGSEINPLIERLKNKEKIIFVIGFPKTKRYLIDGFHYIDDIPLNVTEFSKDPHHPIQSNYILDYVDGELIKASDFKNESVLLNKINQSEKKIIIFDSKDEFDLMNIAKFISNNNLDRYIVGSAGIMEYLMEVWGFKKPRVLIYSGSINNINSNQLNYIKSTIDAKNNKEIVIFDSLKDGICNNKNIVVEQAREIAHYIKDQNINNIIIGGGETAFALLNSLGVKNLHIKAEIEPGVAYGEYGNYRIITKPGGFGSKKIYKKCKEFLINTDNI